MWNVPPWASRRVRCLLLISFISLLASALGLTASSDSGVQADPKHLCVVEGAVVSAEDSLGLRNAYVILVAENDREAKAQRARTDAEGHFTLQQIPAGRYHFYAGHNGFVDKAYGDASEEGVILALSPGQHVKGVLFRLLRQGVITGKVVDEEGEPLARATVTAAKKIRYHGRTRFFGGSEEAESNDLGEYRIFGLRPGSYYVTVSPRSFRYASNDDGSGDVNGRYLTVFFPGTTDASQAEPLQVHAGEEVHADVTMVRVRGVDIRGQVKVALPGAAKADRAVMLIPLTRVEGLYAPLTANPSGPDSTFEFHNVPPGAYDLSVHLFYDGKPHGAEQRLEVGTTNISGIVLIVGGGISIPGRVRIEGGISSNLERLTVALLPDSEDELISGNGEVKPNGKFNIEDVQPGRYTLHVWGLPKNMYVKSVHFGSQDVTRSGFTIAAEKGAAPFEILLNNGPAEVTGVVADAEGKPAQGSTVALVPDPPGSGRDERYATSRTDQYGRFTLKGVVPGKYNAYAWDVIEVDAYQDPDFLKKFDGRSTKIELQERDSKTLNLPLIRTGINPEENEQ